MASVKNTIVLGCFMVLCTVLFIVFNPNRHQLVYEGGALLRMDGLTGKVRGYAEPGSPFTDGFNSKVWWNIPETKSQDN